MKYFTYYMLLTLGLIYLTLAGIDKMTPEVQDLVWRGLGAWMLGRGLGQAVAWALEPIKNTTEKSEREY